MMEELIYPDTGTSSHCDSLSFGSSEVLFYRIISLSMSDFANSHSIFQNAVLTAHKQESCYNQLRTPSVDVANLGIAASSKFIAYHESSGSNSAIGVLPVSSVGRHHIPLLANAYQQPLIRAHAQAVSDVHFDPNNPELLYSCSTDATVKVWGIPSDGLLADLSIPKLTLQTKDKTPMRGLTPNKTVRGILAARSSRDVHIFDVARSSLVNSTISSDFAADMYSISWSYLGDLLLATAKDRTMKLLDMRLREGSRIVSSIITHDNNRPITALWLGDSPYIATLGHSASAEREIKVWDHRKLDSSSSSSSFIQCETVDKSSAGQLLGFFDADTSLLVTAGKGDSSVRLYEFGSSAGLHNIVSDTTTTTTINGAAKGATLFPKQVCDLEACEVLRLLRVVDDFIQPVSIQVPREGRGFHEELYPPSLSESPQSMDADMWAAGLLVPHMKVILAPGLSRAPKLADALPHLDTDTPPVAVALAAEIATAGSFPVAESVSVGVSGDIMKSASSSTPKIATTTVPPVTTPASLTKTASDNTTINSTTSNTTSTSHNKSGASISNFGSTQKYRHLHGSQAPKERTYFNLRPQVAACDGPVIACSDLYWAIPYQGSGGGPVYVSRHDNFGKVEPVCNTINGHKSPVTDISFSPFHSGLFATASQDAKIKIWSLSEDPAPAPESSSEFLLNSRSMTDEDAVGTLATHGNTVKTVNFHPTIDSLLCSSSTDGTVRFFDVRAASEVSCFSLEKVGISGAVTNISYNYNGSLISLACKDKSIRILDPRTNTLVLSVTGSSPRASSSSSASSTAPSSTLTRGETALALGRNLRAEWCSNSNGSSGTILSVCLASNGCRMMHSWDPRRMDAPLCGKNIDSGAGQLYPIYDEGTGVCLLAGKGDRIIRFYEVSFLREVIASASTAASASTGTSVDDEQQQQELDAKITASAGGATFDKCSEFQAIGDPISGLCVLPKRTCNVRNVEIARVLKLTGNAVQPISFTVPRAEALKKYFQDDIFPPTRSKTPSAATVADWIGLVQDSNSYASSAIMDPVLESLRPDDMVNLSEKPDDSSSSSKSKIGQFRAEIDKTESENKQREDTFSRLQRLANEHAAYHPNLSMGGLATATTAGTGTAAAGKSVAGIVGKRVDATPVYDNDSDDGGWDD